MTLARGVLPPTDKDEMFVGWAKAPAVDRRFLLGALPVACAATTGVGAWIASALDDPGAGSWETGATHEVTGVLVRDPYPMIRVDDADAPFGMWTVLVVAEGKCTSGLDLAAAEGKLFTASGVLIQRGERRMLEVPLGATDWLLPVAARSPTPSIAQNPPVESLGRARLAGMIMDSKCFFGVMRPGRGKTHKACAALCIRGGIPPSFWARDREGREAVLLMTDANGGALKEAILPLVADPVKAEGEIVRVGDLLQFRADSAAYRRHA